MPGRSGSRSFCACRRQGLPWPSCDTETTWPPCSARRRSRRPPVPRVIVVGAVAGLLIAWNWLRIEHGSGDGEALLVVVLALVPSLVGNVRYRIAAAARRFLIPAGGGLHPGPGNHSPGRVLGRFGQGFLD